MGTNFRLGNHRWTQTSVLTIPDGHNLPSWPLPMDTSFNFTITDGHKLPSWQSQMDTNFRFDNHRWAQTSVLTITDEWRSCVVKNNIQEIGFFEQLVTLPEPLRSPLGFLVWSILIISLICVLSCYVSLRSEFPVIIFPHKYCVRFVFISSCLLEGLCVIILFVLFAHIDIVLCFCFVFIRLMYPMQPVFLYCPFLISPSVLSNVFFLYSAHFFQNEIDFVFVCHNYQIAKVNMFYMLFCVKLLEWLVRVMVVKRHFQ